MIEICGKIDLSRIATQAFGWKSMRLFGLCAAVILCACSLSATQAAEHFGQWSLEQPEDFTFALSFRRSPLFDDRSEASQLAFICNQERKDVAVLLIPRDHTFSSRHRAIPVAFRKIEEKSDQSDLQRWENGPGYIFLEPPDEQEELATYLKDRESEGVKSVHFYFPNDLDEGIQAINHIIIELPGFSGGVAAFTNRCESQ
jgi:hypothetical protein